MKNLIRKILLLLVIAMCFAKAIQAQDIDNKKLQYYISGKDTFYIYTLHTVWCIDKKKFATDLERYQYNQLKYNIKVVFPYVKEAGRIVNEVKEKLPTLTNRERRKFIKQKEEELRVRFEDPLKNLYDTQGKLLILLINRETGNSVYQVLKDIKNPVRAAMYETTAIVNGLNLNEKWDAKKYKSEEEIMENYEMMYGYAIPVVN
ncbi:MAG: hypothetical protein RJA07_1753 [Bacteroidota bacterium]|jgi:hypothetical protein